MAKRTPGKTVATLTHGDASRKNIPTAEYQAVMAEDDRSPIQVAYERRNRDLDPQLVWRGKDAQDRADLVAQATPLFIQEKVHPQVLINDLVNSGKRRVNSAQQGGGELPTQIDLFADFNGLPSADARTKFYQHDANWSNRMILGDSLKEWAIIEPMIPKQGAMGRPRQTDSCEAFNAIQYVLATGCQWRSLPSDFPPHSTVMNYFYGWPGSGVFDRMMDALRDLARAATGRGVEPTAAIIDSQSVKTTEAGGPRGYDGGKKVVGRKRHIAVDVEGAPIVVEVHAASVQDRDNRNGSTYILP